MGDWSYLAANRTPNPNYFLDWAFTYDDVQIIMAAKYALPPLWCSLFEESDLHICSLIFEGDESSSHPVYMTLAETGIRRAVNRRSKFSSLFPENIDHVYDKWLKLLLLFRGYYIHMDWSAVANMGDENETEKMNGVVQAGVRAFESDVADDWKACFEICGATFDTKTKQVILNPYSKNSPGSMEGDLYGHRFVRRTNKRGNLEWIVESEETPRSKKWWKW